MGVQYTNEAVHAEYHAPPEIFVSDGSTIRTDAQILAQTAKLELEFNGTVDDVPVYTQAEQTFILTSGATLASNQTGVTLFQF